MTVRAVAGQRLDIDKAGRALRPTVAAHLLLDARLQPTVGSVPVLWSPARGKQAELPGFRTNVYRVFITV